MTMSNEMTNVNVYSYTILVSETNKEYYMININLRALVWFLTIMTSHMCLVKF